MWHSGQLQKRKAKQEDPRRRFRAQRRSRSRNTVPQSATSNAILAAYPCTRSYRWPRPYVAKKGNGNQTEAQNPRLRSLDGVLLAQFLDARPPCNLATIPWTADSTRAQRPFIAHGANHKSRIRVSRFSSYSGHLSLHAKRLAPIVRIGCLCKREAVPVLGAVSS